MTYVDTAHHINRSRLSGPRLVAGLQGASVTASGSQSVNALISSIRAERLARRIEKVLASGRNPSPRSGNTVLARRGQETGPNPLPDTQSTAKAIVRDATGKVLVMRDARTGGWDIPGGHLHAGESVTDGLLREVYEETGLTPFKAIYRRQQGNTALFDAEVAGSEPEVTMSDEHTEYRWVQEGKAKDYAAFWMGGYGAHDAIRAEAQQSVQRAVSHIVALAEARELTEKKDDDEQFFLMATAVLTAALAGAYGVAARKLANNATGQDRGESLTQHEEAEYGASRQEFLERFPRVVQERIHSEASRGRAQGETGAELVARVREAGDEINAGTGKVVAETEAQSIYGRGQLRALRRAGYETAYWVTVGDERVRDSHTRCEAAGAVRIGDRFPNGLMYPGDPAGGPEEVCNCRCWLEGASRGRQPVTGSEPHNPEGHNQYTGPKIFKLSESTTLNKLGHPHGTTYHATPGDWATWNDLLKKPLTEEGVWPAREAMKNKHGGMPPAPPFKEES